MKLPLPRKIILVILLIAVAVVAFLFISPNNKIDFNAQVKPIFNKKCIACHGGVKQQAGFSLLFREEALANTQSGKPAIIPGHPEKSELIRRITEKNTEERMPYKHDPLSQNEISILKKWIKQGAEWGVHWAYVPVKKQTLPGIENSFIKNDVDRFVLQKLEEEKLPPSPEADKGTLLRRVSLDLTGLPPADNIAQKFLTDTSTNAYKNLVADLLATNDYGERWTALWMDLARYGDTKGFESDQGRNIWRYRDWLIKAFNDDKPYNDFLIEQLAGDLMPDADDEKYIATAFHRNTMTNDEGGTDNEEFRTAAIMDRVNTTWSALLGTSFNCVQCHSHPYDPFKHDEYYKFMAFFNNSRDEDTESDYPLLRHFKTADSLKLLKLTAWLQQNSSPKKTQQQIHFLKTGQPSINSMQCDEVQKGQIFFKLFLSFYNGGTARLQNVTTQNKNQIIFRYLNSPDNATWSIYVDSLNGRLLKTVALRNTKNKWAIHTVSIPEVAGQHNLYFKYNATLKKKDEPGIMFDWFHFGEALPGKNLAGYDSAAKYFNDLVIAEAETTPVMVENTSDQKRPTYVFERGNWTVKTDEVNAGVPDVMNAMPANAPNNRLGLALWMTDKKNPLTARTMVNRLWEQLFGIGLAETLEDLGTQGMPPTHAALLDHLSWKFMNEHQWSIKKLLTEIVLSSTYRQQSKTNAALIEKDPNNIFLARGPRVRLSGEQLRDQALAVSGLLSKKMYGKSVMPYQPNDIWRSPYNGDKWITSAGEDKHRRAIYTYWKRTAPYPSMMTFDGSSREVCITRRIRTNTPLQALATLNDSAYLIMARHFALRMQQQGGKEINTQIKKGYEAMMYKPISKPKLEALLDLYNTSIIKFKNNEVATCEVMGEQGLHTKPETAAMVVVANAMLNLDEWVNK